MALRYYFLMLTRHCKPLLLTVSLLATSQSYGESPRSYAAVADLPADKAAHFGLSGMATIATMRLWQVADDNPEITTTNRIISSLLVFGVGIAKEVTDRNKKGDHALDAGDLNADAAGIVTANILMIKF